MKRVGSGFTLVELLVVITIISILMGLLIPAVNAAREAARNAECGVNVKNLALASIQHEGTKGYLPGWIVKHGFFPGGPDRSDLGNFSGSVPQHAKVSGYGVSLLPWLEAQATYEQWTDDSYPVISNGMGDLDPTGGVPPTGAGANFHAYAAPNLEVFQCPSNPIADAPNGRNSYIVNNGMAYIRTPVTAAATGGVGSLTQTHVGAQKKYNGTSKCRYVSPNSPPGTETGPPTKLADLKDGLGFTALFSENVQAMPWYMPGFLYGHLEPVTRVRTLIPTDSDYPQDLEHGNVNVTLWGEMTASQFCAGMVWHFEDRQAALLNGASPTYDSPTGANIGNNFSLHQINGGGATVSDDIYTLQMTLANCVDLARPSSAHVDGVNMGFADGATRYISSGIDYRVYQALLTTRGKSSDVPWAEFVITDELGTD